MAPRNLDMSQVELVDPFYLNSIMVNLIKINPNVYKNIGH